MVRVVRALLNITARREGIIMELLIGFISGAVGGNVAGGVSKNLNQGTLINSISGIVGVVKNMMAK